MLAARTLLRGLSWFILHRVGLAGLLVLLRLIRLVLLVHRISPHDQQGASSFGCNDADETYDGLREIKVAH
jgi:hypothetical protein